MSNNNCYGSYPLETTQACLTVEEQERLQQESRDKYEAARKAKFDRYDQIHEDMITRARDFIDQGARSCAARVGEIENRYVLRYNEYISFLNGDSSLDAKSLEKNIELIIDEWELVPRVCY